MPPVAPKVQHRNRSLPSGPSQFPHLRNTPQNLNSQAYTTNSEPEMNTPQNPSTPPRTPRKEGHAQQPSQNKANAPEIGSKQKSKTKRPKNVMTSPAVTRNGRNTPPLAGTQSAGISSSAKAMYTPSTTAYAGPTFHASPAPSALPIPSFYSKSVPESPGLRGITAMKEPSISPPDMPAVKLNTRREESPLDIFFRADREEKARARSATQTISKPTGPFQPPSGGPRSNQTTPGSVNQTRPRNQNRMSSSGMFAMEIDGDSGPASPQPFGPAFSTPYSERINAARSVTSNGFSSPSSNDGHRTESSEALKAYLLSGRDLSPAGSVSNSGRDGVISPFASTTATGSRSGGTSSNQNTGTTSTRALNNATTGRSSGLRKEVAHAWTPTKTPDRNNDYVISPTPSRMYDNFNSSKANNVKEVQQPPMMPSYDVSSGNRLKDMEDGLRRILKLDQTGNSGTTGSGANNQAGNIPSGRHQPNGMHNGVKGS